MGVINALSVGVLDPGLASGSLFVFFNFQSAFRVITNDCVLGAAKSLALTNKFITTFRDLPTPTRYRSLNWGLLTRRKG